MKIHNGTSWVNTTPHVHNGTSWVTPSAAYVHNGTQWVQVWKAITSESIDTFNGGLHAGWQGGDANENHWETYTTRKMEGTSSVRAVSGQNDSLNIYSYPGQGLPRYFAAGEKAHFHFYNSSDATGVNHLFRWGAGSGSGWMDVFIRNGISTPDILLRRETTAGVEQTQQRSTKMLPFNRWIRVEVTRGDGPNHWNIGANVHRVRFYNLGVDGTAAPTKVSDTLTATYDGLSTRSGIRHWISSGLGTANEFLLDDFHVVLP